MARSGERGPTESGVLVYPKLPVPKGRESDPRMSGSRGFDKKKALLWGGLVAGGLVLGFLVRPLVKTDGRVGELEDKLATATASAGEQTSRANNLEKDLDKANEAKQAAQKKLADAQKAQAALESQAKEAASKVKESEAVQAKLKAAVDKSVGIISADGSEIRLQLVDKVMFKTLDDQLTDRGKQVLDRLAVALKEIPDKQIWVQGHTDDQPIVQPPAPKQPPPKKGAKPVPVVVPPPKFATNWELSAARALTVVHYLQDVSKIEPSRLAALAFGQYRPVSKTNRAANRRIEIVLYPKPVAVKK